MFRTHVFSIFMAHLQSARTMRKANLGPYCTDQTTSLTKNSLSLGLLGFFFKMKTIPISSGKD